MSQNVNATTKETIDTIDYAISWMTGAWESTPLELRAFILSVFTISILMQWVKKALLVNKTKRQRVTLLWTSSLPLGLSLALLGYFLSEGQIHLGYWAVIGLTSGSTAMGVHFITVKAMWPVLQTVGQAAWDRVMLLVRGKPNA